MAQRLTILRGAAIFAVSFVSAPVLAQPIIDTDAFPTAREVVEIDVTGDGIADRFQVFPLNYQYDVLSFDTGYPNGFTEHSAYIVPINLSDSPSITARSNGGFALNWGCFACGRTHSASSVTLRLEDDELRVIGYDHSYADRLYAAVFTCSVNLLSSKAIIEAIGVETRAVGTKEAPFALAHMPDGYVAKACDGLSAFDDAYLEKHYPSQ